MSSRAANPRQAPGPARSPGGAGERWAQRLRPLAGVVLALGMARALSAVVGSFRWPLGRDQGIFAWVADVVLAGGAPYVDAWEQKGPAVGWSFALVQLLFGAELWGVRVLDAAMFLGGLGIFAWVLRRRAAPLALFLTATLTLCLHYRMGYWCTAQPDGWAALACALAWALAIDGAGRAGPGMRRRAWLGGLLLAYAVLVKLTFALWILPCVGAALAAGGDGARGRARVAVHLLLGGAVGLGSAFAALASMGAFGAYLEVQLDFNMAVHRSLHGRGAWDHVLQLGHLLQANRVWLPLALGLLAWLPLPTAPTGTKEEGRAANHRLLRRGAVGLILTGVVAIVLQDKYYDYHAAPLYLPVALLAGLGTARTLQWQRVHLPARGARVAGLMLLVVASFAVRPRADLDGWVAHAGEGEERDRYWGTFKTAGGDFDFLANARVAAYLRAHTDPAERVEVFGFEPLILHLAGRSAPTRFGFRHPLTAREGDPLIESYREEYLAAMRAAPPAYVVLALEDENNLFLRASDEEAERIGLGQLLATGYGLETRIGNFELYRRRDGRRVARGE